MSIPHVKQRHAIRECLFNVEPYGPVSEEAKKLGRIPVPKKILITALMLCPVLFGVPGATAQYVDTIDSFDQYNAGFFPPIPDSAWVFEDYNTIAGTQPSNIQIVNTPSVSGKALNLPQFQFSGAGATALAPQIIFASSLDCTGDTQATFEYDFRVETGVVNSDATRYGIVLANTLDNSRFSINLFNDDADLTMQAFVTTSTGATASGTLGTITTGEFWHFQYLGFDCAEEEFRVAISKTADGSSLQTVSVNGASLAGIMTAPNYFKVERSTQNNIDVVPSTTFDNLQVTGIPIEPVVTPDSNQVAVTTLTGYSMDAGGRNIVSRESNGITIKTYGVSDLLEISSASTPDCTGRFDGVNAAIFPDFNDVTTIWITYVDCDGDGESDAFRIRDYALQPPDFSFCDEATDDIDNNAEIDVPNNLGDIGTISDLDPSFVQRCGPGGFDDASVGWTFSTVGGAGIGGKIGAFAVTYNSGIIVDRTDEETVALDTTSTPSVNHFCSWQNPEGRDFIAGAVDNGPTGAYEVISSVTTGQSIEKQPDVDLVTLFQNSGQYGNAAGIACAQNSLFIQSSTAVSRVNAINTDSPIAAGSPWPISIAGGTVERGIAVTGSGFYIAIVDGSNIKIYNTTSGNLTTTFTKPTGTWRGMEFDNSGEHLAVFTSTFITVYETGEMTCGLDNNCASLGNVQEEGCSPNEPCFTATATSTQTATGGNGIAGLDEDQSVMYSIITVGAFGLLAIAISRGSIRRKPDDERERDEE